MLRCTAKFAGLFSFSEEDALRDGSTVSTKTSTFSEQGAFGGGSNVSTMTSTFCEPDSLCLCLGPLPCLASVFTCEPPCWVELEKLLTELSKCCHTAALWSRENIARESSSTPSSTLLRSWFPASRARCSFQNAGVRELAATPRTISSRHAAVRPSPARASSLLSTSLRMVASSEINSSGPGLFPPKRQIASSNARQKEMKCTRPLLSTLSMRQNIGWPPQNSSSKMRSDSAEAFPPREMRAAMCGRHQASCL
mmetsp:Transcript_61136/g.111457  ORF Transcript_61136/g.111457 Transcript_61136/m.111457 type:complete len:253 (+) Transcript_61136:296-1054(+)